MLRIALAIVLTLAAGLAYAQFNKCGPGICPNGTFNSGGGFPSIGGAVIPPPACSNQLDFSQACNSQYLL